MLNENSYTSGTVNTTTLRDYQMFQSPYYNGCDVSIYFGDIWVDEVNGIAFKMDEKSAPLFGYASYVYDRTVTGSRIVQGSFTINFVEAGYLYAIINKLSDKKMANIPDIINRTANLINNSSFKIDGKTFEEFANYYEKALWDNRTVESAVINQPSLSRKTFDILITYGDYKNKAVSGEKNTQSTAKIIRDVNITSVQQIVDTSDNPVQEMYTFYARDIEFV